jgi:hypothetical protein
MMKRCTISDVLHAGVKRNATRLADGRARGLAAIELDRMDPLFEAHACRQDRYEAL